jgi:hypothetical protein
MTTVQNDHGGGDNRAQQAHPADLAGRADVAGENRGQDDTVDDHCLGELGDHFMLLVCQRSLGNRAADLPNHRGARPDANRSRR